MKKKTAKRTSKKEIVTTENDNDFLLRHELFIEEYLVCFNGTRAYLYSHPDLNPEDKDDYDVASQSASRLLRNVKIKQELDKRFSARMMSKKEVLDRLRSQADATLLPFVKIDDDGYIYFNFKHPEAKKNFHLIKKVKHKKTVNMANMEEEHWVEVELHDPQRALELIGKYYALFTEKVQQTEKKVIHVTFKKEEE